MSAMYFVVEAGEPSDRGAGKILAKRVRLGRTAGAYLFLYVLLSWGLMGSVISCP